LHDGFCPTAAPESAKPAQVQSLAFFYSDLLRFILSSYSDVPQIKIMTKSTAIMTSLVLYQPNRIDIRLAKLMSAASLTMLLMNELISFLQRFYEEHHTARGKSISAYGLVEKAMIRWQEVSLVAIWAKCYQNVKKLISIVGRQAVLRAFHLA